VMRDLNNAGVRFQLRLTRHVGSLMVPIGSMFVSLHVVDAMRICSQVVLSAVGRSEVLHA